MFDLYIIFYLQYVLYILEIPLKKCLNMALRTFVGLLDIVVNFEEILFVIHMQVNIYIIKSLLIYSIYSQTRKVMLRNNDIACRFDS